MRPLFTILPLISTCCVTSATSAERPNIIVVFTDDHGYSDLSCQGIVNDIRTPHIDALAAGGVRMTSGYVTAPQCVPSRAGLLSGRYQNRIGVESNGQPLDGFNAEQTIAERLKKAGYATGMVGKWHLGPTDRIVEHGFDDVFYRGGSWTNFGIDGTDRDPGSTFTEMYHLDAGSAAAKAFIKRHHQEPFFLYLAYRAPHVPLDATEKYLKRFPGEMPERRRKALAMLSAVDDGVGGVMESLREFDIEEKTLVFFIGDNGAPLKIHKLDAPGGGPGWDGSLNEPLNGEKGMLSEGGIRVPFVAYWKGHIDGGQEYSHPVISLDVAATAVALAGQPADPQLDGVNLIPYLTRTNLEAPHQELYWRWITQAAIREGKWKYLRGGARTYLFDLETDREEKMNLQSEHPEVARRLSEKLTRWSQELSPPGLETKSMSTTWEQYFDHYLDGKRILSHEVNRKRANTFDGWVLRNGTAKHEANTLVLRSDGSRQGPFIAAASLSLPKKFKVAVRMRAVESGSAAIAWRQSGQKDFAKGQVVEFKCDESQSLQDYEVNVTADKKVIHLRLILPPVGADVGKIEIRNMDDRPIKTWSFANTKAKGDQP